ncbi:phosphotransferase [Streptomyces castrisilvae]|uniref:Phosphotransferase n=1 Tax=Streptomyces castrisilvae TaxID=3033811 RepID=A0ABY9HRE9_9ACTN|nr:phosphotransferase [Streptomyces sp. Mut1]WLQ37127.1 phosphotransferase [Streptomyces sp. Mut1]
MADHATGSIAAAARELWPTSAVRLGAVVPSVTSHVQRLTVDGSMLYAKAELLGMSLVSVIRGSGGDWPMVKAAQRAYLAGPDTLLEREAKQIQVLAAVGLCVPEVVGYRPGVLFTAYVHGATLAELIAASPGRTADLLHLVHQELAPVRRGREVAALVDHAPIVERSIPGTFQRKFNGAGDAGYLRRSPHEEVLRDIVFRVRRANAAASSPLRRVIFGDLKPEHVLFPSDGGRPTFIDPGLMRDPPCGDLAKLLSRLFLDLVARRPGEESVRMVLEQVAVYTDAAATRLSALDEGAHLRQLVTLWLMDTTNILTTYLSHPTGLPMTRNAAAVVARAGAVCQMLDLCTSTLALLPSGRDLWRLCLAHVAQAATR